MKVSRPSLVSECPSAAGQIMVGDCQNLIRTVARIKRPEVRRWHDQDIYPCSFSLCGRFLQS
jgi:hypothetical protein